MHKALLAAATSVALVGCGAFDRHLSQNLEVVEAGDERQQIYFNGKLLYEGHILAESKSDSSYTFFVVDVADRLCNMGRVNAYFGSTIRQVTVTDTAKSQLVLPAYTEAIASAKRELARLQSTYPQFFKQGQSC